MYQSDIKILELIQILKSLGIIGYDYEFCDSIGFLKQNLIRVKKGLAHFTAEHINNTCKVYNVNSNWIFDIEKHTFRIPKASIKSTVKKSSMPTTLKN